MPKLAKLVFPMSILALACGSEDPGEADDGAGTSEASTGEEPAPEPEPGTTEASEDETGGEEQGVPARGGITISRVEANPGVAVPIGADGAWVGAEGRNAPLPKLRDTALRVYVDVDEDTWIQRDIEARLTLVLPDDTVQELSETVTIAADSSITSMQSGFLFGVLADWMVPGVRYQVQLYEAGTGWEDLPPVEVPPSTPATPEPIGVEGTELAMRVVMVPVDYSGPGCSQAVDPTEETLADYADAMYQQNPLTTLDIRWDEPYVVDDLDLTNGDDFFTLLGRAQQYRASQAPDPNVYYYLLFDNCGQCISNDGGCLLGVAPGLASDSMAAAGLRVAIGTRFLGNSEVGIETFVHEIGHTQGRAHVACPGVDSLGPDPDYPHDDGEIGVWGFGVRDFQIRNATTHTDYMSYCNPTWVSDWQWSATFQRIQTLTSWDLASASMPDTHVLVGAINLETGQAQWWTDRGATGEASEGHQVRFWAGDEVVQLSDAQIDAWSEGPMITVRAPLPADYDLAVTEIEYLAPTRELTVPRAEIPSYHRVEASP